MTELFLLLAGASLVYLVLMVWLTLRKHSEGEDLVSSSTLLFALWVVSTAFWGGYFLKIHVGGLFDITIDRVLFLLVLLIVASGIASGRVFRNRNLALETTMILFCLVCFVSMVLHGFKPDNPSYPSPWNLFINGYLFPFVAFVFAKNYVTDERDIRMLLQTLFLMGLYLAVISYFEFMGWRRLVYPQFINDPEITLHLDRARGPFLNAAFNGVALIVGFVSGCHLLATSAARRTTLGRLGPLLLVPFIPAIFFTQTRSIYLGFAIALMILFLFYRTGIPKWKAFALPLAVLLVVLLSSTPRLASKERREGGILQLEEVLVRASLFTRSLVMFEEQPLAGVGLGRFIPTYMEQYRGRVVAMVSTENQAQHNHLLGMLVELGLVGVLLYLAIIIQLFRRIAQAFSEVPRDGIANGNLLVVISTVLLVQLFCNQFVEPSYCLFVNVVFFFFGGLADGLYDRFARHDAWKTGTFRVLAGNSRGQHPAPSHER